MHKTTMGDALRSIDFIGNGVAALHSKINGQVVPILKPEELCNVKYFKF